MLHSIVEDRVRRGQRLNEKARMNVGSLSVATERYVQCLHPY